MPKNIYGATKVAAEDICRLVHVQAGLPTLVLRTSRFFPEEDDDDARRAAMDRGIFMVNQGATSNPSPATPTPSIATEVPGSKMDSRSPP